MVYEPLLEDGRLGLGEVGLLDALFVDLGILSVVLTV